MRKGGRGGIRSPHHPLPHEKPHPESSRLKGDPTAAREVEDVAAAAGDALARLVADDELAVDDHLHLVVRVLVHQRRARLQPVQAARDGRRAVRARLRVRQPRRARREDVAEVCVFVGY